MEIHKSWSSFFTRKDIQSHMEKIETFLDSEYTKYGNELLVLPPKHMRFNRIQHVSTQ